MNRYQEEFKASDFYQNGRFSKLSSEDNKLYEEYIRASSYPCNVWAGNFAYLYAYTQSAHLSIYKGFVKGILVSAIVTEKGRFYLPHLPYGAGSRKELIDVLILCGVYSEQFNRRHKIQAMSLVNPVNEAQLDYLNASLEFKRFFKESPLTGFERHYSVTKLVELKGKEFAKVRNHLNQFNRLYPEAAVRMYEDSDFERVMKLKETWERASGVNYERIIDRHYFEPIVKNCKALKHLILVVQYQRELIGMISGGILPTGEAWGCLMKFDKSYRGISEYLTVAMAKKLRELSLSVELINVGSDLGAKGLAQSKESYRPSLSLRRYALFFKEVELK